MDNSYRFWRGGLLFFVLFLGASIFLACGDDDSRKISFQPGTYHGTYRTVEHVGTPQEIIRVDTLSFYFSASYDTFRMDTFPGRPDPLFCPAMGKYLFTGDSLKLYDVVFTYIAICVPTKPEGGFRYNVESRALVFRTSDTALYRRIDLWVD